MNTLIKRFLNTNNNQASLVLRVILGIVLFAHGAQLMLGWFGGHGFAGSMQYFTEIAGLPYIIGFTVIALQFFGSILILIGFITRLVAIGVLGMFIGMILTVHYQYGFFMNWFGNSPGEGYEYHLLVLGITGALTLLGGGALSVDEFLANRIK